MPKEIKTPTTMQKIRMVTYFFENAVMPDEMLPDEIDNLDAAIIKATRAIRQKPRNFLNHPYFSKLMKLLADIHGTYILSIGFPINVLKPAAQEKLKELPLPVEIRGGITGGIKDGFALIDWFTTDNPQPRKKTAELITDFLGALVEALNSQ